MGMIWSITGRYLAGIDLYGLIFFKRLLAAFALTYGQERFMKQRKVPYGTTNSYIVLSTMRSVHFFITIFFIVCLIFSSTCPNPPPHAPPKMPPQRCPPKDAPPKMSPPARNSRFNAPTKCLIATMVFSNGSEAFKGVGAPSLQSEVSGECSTARWLIVEKNSLILSHVLASPFSMA
jgi:hypothetical protein